MKKRDAILLVNLQDDFPLVARPYRIIAERLGIDEVTVCTRVREFVKERLLRRLGPRYNSRKLGMKSTLSAARVAPEQLASVVTFLSGLPEVTHCYERSGSTCNLWFTLTARSDDRLERILADFAGLSGVDVAHNLPAERVYKLRVRFVPISMKHLAGPPVSPLDTDVTPDLDETDRHIISATQRGLPVVLRPYAEVASGLGLTVEELLNRLRAMCVSGVIRTMGAVADGPALGYRGNALVAWQVSATDCDRAGELFAGFDEVSHCYRRPALADFPYPLYTMVHGRDAEELERVLRRMSQKSGLDRFVMLPTVREFKKTAAVFPDPDSDA